MGHWPRWIATRLRSRTARSVADKTATVAVYHDGVLQGTVRVVLRATNPVLSVTTTDALVVTTQAALLRTPSPLVIVASDATRLAVQIAPGTTLSVAVTNSATTSDRTGSTSAETVARSDAATLVEWFVVGKPSHVVFTHEVQALERALILEAKTIQ